MRWSVVLAAEESSEVPEGINLFIPPLYDLFWGAVMFVALFVVFWKYVLPNLKKTLEARSDGIERKLERAEAERADAHALLEQYHAQLTEARTDAARIRAEAQSERQNIVTQARTEAELAAAAVNERAGKHMEAEAAQVRQALSRDVGTLSVTLAEKIVGESLDDERVSRTVDRFIEELESAAQIEESQSVTASESR